MLVQAYCASLLEAVEPAVSLGVLARCSVVFARVDYAVASEGYRIVQAILEIKLVLLQAGVADIRRYIIE
jgi:hypothetical protein